MAITVKERPVQLPACLALLEVGEMLGMAFNYWSLEQG